MYVLHTVLTIVSGELFYQTYIPMISPIGSEAVRSPPALSLSLGTPTLPVLSCGSSFLTLLRQGLGNCFKLCSAFCA